MLGRALLIGGSGMLGRAWQELLEREALEHDAPPRTELDLGDADWDLAGYGTVINCAAWTDVDGAETHESEATKINGEAVGRLARACANEGATLIHYSTDYVFNGNATEPYPTEAPIEPLNAYGRSKAVGEAAIAESGCRHLTARTSWLYAPWGKNFVLTMANLTRSKDELRVVDDQRGRPTSAEHLASASLGMLRAGVDGFHHITDGGECTWHGFAQEINRTAADGRCTVHPCTSDEYPRPAKRPPYSVMDLSETEAAIGPMPDWRENLRAVISRLED
ncbi:MAG: dTDP-4-dehydrorhamnose reductase [Planctomycetota bacterium]